jgi:hypothetical protein
MEGCMSRKPRSDARLLSLPLEQQEQIASWLTIENLSYETVRAKIAKELGVQTSAGALHSFYSTFAAGWKYSRAKGEADAFAQLLDGRFDEATTKRVQQLAFECLAGPQPDLKAAKTLIKIVGDTHKLTLQQQRLELDARKVALLEKKAAQADEAKAVTDDSALTAEEKLARMRQIFGGG